MWTTTASRMSAKAGIDRRASPLPSVWRSDVTGDRGRDCRSSWLSAGGGLAARGWVASGFTIARMLQPRVVANPFDSAHCLRIAPASW